MLNADPRLAHALHALIAQRTPTLPSPNVSNARLALKRRSRGPTGPASGGGKVPAVKGMLAGLAVGAVLLAPVVSGPLSARPLGGFLPWAAIAALVATLEETSIRGVLYRRLGGGGRTGAALLRGAARLAPIQPPRDGPWALPPRPPRRPPPRRLRRPARPRPPPT